ncbi:MAG: protoporphyrinogen oxidase [Actinomycetota bacterium]
MSTAVIIGGGITGLCAAHDLAAAGHRVKVYEASDRWGGKVWSSPVGDRLVDAGPDTFLARVAPGRQLCEDLGLADELTSPVSAVPAYIARDGRLHELPAGSMLGVPTDLDVLRRGQLISADGIRAAEADLTMPSSLPADGGDLSVGALCRARLGDEITDYLIDPLLGGINASDIDHLSLRAGALLLASAVERGPSLMKEMAALRPATGPTLGTPGTVTAPPVFHGLPGGIARIVDTLVGRLEADDHVKLHRSSPVTDLAEVAGADDDVLITTPAFAAAELVRRLSPPAADELATIRYASVAQATVELPIDADEVELDASGILFPRAGGTMLTACTWLSTKWAHYRRPGTVLLRLTSGRFGDERPADHDDIGLTRALLADLGTVVEIRGEPTATRVHRWHRAFPQYMPGHGERVARIDEALAADAPRVRLAGAAYRGIGLPACIDGGRTAARAVLHG